MGSAGLCRFGLCVGPKPVEVFDLVGGDDIRHPSVVVGREGAYHALVVQFHDDIHKRLVGKPPLTVVDPLLGEMLVEEIADGPCLGELPPYEAP